MRQYLFVVCLFVGLSACQPHLGQLLPTSPPAGKQQILVTFEYDHDKKLLPGGSRRSYFSGGDWGLPLFLSQQVARIEANLNIRRQTSWHMQSINAYCVVFLVNENRKLEALVDELNSISIVETAQVMNEFSGMTLNAEPDYPQYNDAHLDLQYGDFTRHLHQLHSLGRGNSIKVGVIDTVADLEHPDLQGQINQQIRLVKPVSGNHKQTQEFARHGTAISGIIAAQANNGQGLVGLAPEAELNVYAACNSDETGTARCNTFNVLRGLERAIADEIQVLNMSLAGPQDPLIEQVLAVALNKGMVVIAAHNTNGKDSTNSFPASMSGVIGVHEYLGAGEQPPFYFGDWLLNSEKLSTLSGGGYQFFYGSSVSTASLSGIAALLLSHNDVETTRNYLTALSTTTCYQDNKLFSLNNLLQRSATCHSTATVSNKYNSP